MDNDALIVLSFIGLSLTYGAFRQFRDCSSSYEFFSRQAIRLGGNVNKGGFVRLPALKFCSDGVEVTISTARLGRTRQVDGNPTSFIYAKSTWHSSNFEFVKIFSDNGNLQNNFDKKLGISKKIKIGSTNFKNAFLIRGSADSFRRIYSEELEKVLSEMMDYGTIEISCDPTNITVVLKPIVLSNDVVDNLIATVGCIVKQEKNI